MLTQFISDNCVEYPSAIVSVVDFAGAFRAWSVARGHGSPCRAEIVSELRGLGYEIGKLNDRDTVLGLGFPEVKYKIQNGRIVRAVARA